MISIVTAYYNRKEELWRTLKTIEKSSVKDFEFIIVDDGSDWRQRIEDFAKEFSFVRLKRIEPKDKKHINPCIPFNMAFAMAKGDIIILQSPECMHMGDVLEHAANNSKDNQYTVYSCYSLSERASNNLRAVDFNMPLSGIRADATTAIGGFTTNSCDTSSRYDSWFNHPVYRKSMFNFLVSFTTKDLRDLGGFDERFADGHAFDDTDFVARVLKKGMVVEMVADPFCLHQYHRSVLQDVPNFRAAEQRNKRLYEELSKLPHHKVRNSFYE